jgi:hypothetical protein
VHYRHGRDSKVHEFKADGVAEARGAAEALIARAELDGEKVTFGAGNFITLDVPGDGKFRVANTKERLTAFRAQVEKAPGFSDKGQAQVKPKAASAASSGTVAALQNMVEEGDYQAALDYATAKGTTLDELKLTKPERKKLDDWLKTNPQATTEADDVVEPVAEPAPTFEDSFLNKLYGEGREEPKTEEPPKAEDFPTAAAFHAAKREYRERVGAPPAAEPSKLQQQVAEADREIAGLERRIRENDKKRGTLVPPAIVENAARNLSDALRAAKEARAALTKESRGPAASQAGVDEGKTPAQLV